MSIELEVNDLTPIELLSDDADFVGLSLSEAIEGGGGSALTDDVKQALLAVIQNVAFINDDGQDYYDALYAALYPPVNLDHITAQYTQSGTVYPTTSLDSLKSDLVVKAFYTDGTKETVPSTDYTLTGTLDVGTSTVTATYGGQTATFNVTVTAKTLTSISAVYTQSGTVYDTDTLDSLKTDLVVTAHYSDSSTEAVASTDYTLSGTLTAGTSTITVTYGGKTTTFTVTVTASPLYPFVNGTHNFTSPAGSVVVTDGNNAVVKTASNSQKDLHANVSNLATNSSASNSQNNYGTTLYFRASAGSTLSYHLTLTDVVSPSNSAAMSILLKSNSTTLKTIGSGLLKDLSVETEFTGTYTFDSDTDVTCFGIWVGSRSTNNPATLGVTFEAYLDGVQIV